MEGGGTLKGMFLAGSDNTSLREFIDSNRKVDELYKDANYSPQLLVYLDSKTKDQSTTKEPLTIDEAKQILQRLGIEAEDDHSSTNFYGPPTVPQGPVLQMADTALRLNSQQTPASASASAAAAVDAMGRGSVEFARRTADAERAQRICEEELDRVRRELENVTASRNSLSAEIQENSGKINDGLVKISEKDAELNSLRTQLELLNAQLKEQLLAAQTNPALMKEVSELRSRITESEGTIRELTARNEELSSDNAAKQADIDSKTKEIGRLLEKAGESARKDENQDLVLQQLSIISQQRQSEEQAKTFLEEQKRAQLQNFSREIERLKALGSREPTTHAELLQQISTINKLLHFYYLSKNILGETEEGQALQQQISQAEISLKGIQEKLSAKGRECDEFVARIRELEGTIRVLQQQIDSSIGQLPTALAQLRNLNLQSHGISEKLEELQRTSLQNSKELQEQKLELSRSLTRISGEISSLQGEIKTKLDAIQASITSENTELVRIIREQSLASVQAILTGQTTQTAELASKISQHQVELSKQTEDLSKLRDEFTKLREQSGLQLQRNQQVQEFLATCLREKQTAEQDLKTSREMAGHLQTQLARLQTEKEAAEAAKSKLEEQSRRLAETVVAEGKQALQAGQIAQQAQQAQINLQQQLREEQQKGNPRRIEDLERVLAQEQARLREAQLSRETAQAAQQAAETQKQAAEVAQQAAALEIAANRGAAQQAQAAQKIAEESLRGAIEAVANRDNDAERARALESQALQQQIEQQCLARIRQAQDESRLGSELAIASLTERLTAAQQALAAIQASHDATLRTKIQEVVDYYNNFIQTERAREIASISERDNVIRVLTEQRDQVARAEVAAREERDGFRTAAEQERGAREQLERDLGNLTIRLNRAEERLAWHTSSQITITDPNPLPAGILAGTPITFEVANKQRDGRTVVFFRYLDHTEYMDITDDSQKTYIVQMGLQNVGTFNF